MILHGIDQSDKKTFNYSEITQSLADRHYSVDTQAETIKESAHLTGIAMLADSTTEPLDWVLSACEFVFLQNKFETNT